MRSRLMAPVAIAAALLVAGCAGVTETVTGTLVGADGACLYLDVPNADGTTRYGSGSCHPATTRGMNAGSSRRAAV